MKRDLTITIPDHVMIREVGGESVLLDLETEHYFGLDPIGTEILTQMQAGATLGETVDALLDEYEVDEATLRSDVEALMGELSEKGLVEVS